MSGTNYAGGNCKGAVFDSTGATEFGTFSEHFIASNNGMRLDLLLTELQATPVNYIGTFSTTLTALKPAASGQNQ